MTLAIGAILFCQLGVPCQAIRTLFKKLSNMKHFVQTAHSNSGDYYTGSTDNPLQGGGQGNGAAGPMWVAISIVLLRIIATVLINVKMIASISLTSLVLWTIMYVDNTDILFTAKEGMNIEQMK